jgi:hypothetical protein
MEPAPSWSSTWNRSVPEKVLAYVLECPLTSAS